MMKENMENYYLVMIDPAQYRAFNSSTFKHEYQGISYDIREFYNPNV